MSDPPSRPPARHFEPLPEWAGPATRLVHAGRLPDLNAGAITAPIYQTSNFRYPAPYSEAAKGGHVHLYTRISNPTVDRPTEVIRQLEGGEAARLFGSGMGASSAVMLSLLRTGDRVLALADLYGGTTDLLQDLTARFSIRVTEVSADGGADPERLIPEGTRMVWLESPTNPTLRVIDLRRWAEVAHRIGATVVVDNTFATPINQTPIALGADLVVHSATKYLGGHSDIIAGAVVGSGALLSQIDPKNALGACLDPFAAFLLARSLKTLHVRMERHNETGRQVAGELAHHPCVTRVNFPGTASEVEEQIAARQMRGRGAVLSLLLRGGAPAVGRFLRALRIVQVAASLGGVESLASVPAETSHRHLAPAELASRGIEPGLVRISLGLEESSDLVRDISEALDTAHAA